jgi:hypothetical protein
MGRVCHVVTRNHDFGILVVFGRCSESSTLYGRNKVRPLSIDLTDPEPGLYVSNGLRAETQWYVPLHRFESLEGMGSSRCLR